MRLVRPTLEHLPSYVSALGGGWSADNVRGVLAANEELAVIRADPDLFLAHLDDIEARGPGVTLPDGSVVPRIPGLRRWMWDDQADSRAQNNDRFIGSINLRWMAGGGPLPAHVLGHIGYAVVPWHAGRGHATQALGQMLAIARAQGLKSVELTTDPDNLPSQRVITHNGGVLIEVFDKGPAYMNKTGLRFRIDL